MKLAYRTNHSKRAQLAKPGSLFFESLPPHPSKAFSATPRGWISDRLGPWTRVYPRNIWGSYPQHGWKIHVSSVPVGAEETLADVADICERHTTPFKHLSDRPEFLRCLKKYADRLSAGKFITIYPRNEQQFVTLLEELDQRLEGKVGPYVLTDARYAESPVFFRYGAYFSKTLSNGRTGIITPSGEVIEDPRDMKFSVPDFVTIPDAIKHVVEARKNGLKKGADELLYPYKVTGCIHYSFGGGVYRGLDLRDHHEVILKEARAYSGYTSETESSQDRLRSEAEVLKELEYLEFVPRLRDYLTLSDHEFIVEDFIEGGTLQDWIASNYPFLFEQPIEPYEVDALKISRQLIKIVQSANAEGVAIMDLQPKNIMIERDLTVRLIDLEGARPIMCESRDVLGTPGFMPLRRCSNRERDAYSLFQVLLYMFAPSLDSVLSPGLEQKRIDFISETFSEEVLNLIEHVRAELSSSVTKPRLGLGANCTSSVRPQSLQHEWEQYRHKIISGIFAARKRVEKTAPIFPGDARQLWDGPSAQWDLETGTAGIVLALSRLGVDTHELAVELAENMCITDLPEEGLLRGLPGIALAMAEAGEPEIALTLAGHQNRFTSKNANIRSGVAGTVLSYLSLCQYGINVRFIRELLADFEETLNDSDTYVDGSGAETGNAVGLFDGWCGVAVACEAAFRRTGNIDWHRRAETLLERDVCHLKASDQGAQYGDMSGVNYGYLSEGSAGIGVACSIVDQARYKNIIKEISMSLGPRLCLSAGLFQGQAGLAASLMMIGGAECESVVEQEVNNLLRMKSFSVDDDEAIYFPGNHSYCLSSDYSTGAAGIALSVDGYCRRWPAWVPWSPRLFDGVEKGGGW